MNKKKWFIAVLLVAGAGIAVWLWKFREEKTVIVLKTEKPEHGSIAISITATGTIQPVDTVTVGSQVSGTINKVYVDFNSTVRKGQLLAQLDKSLLAAQVQQTEANLAQAKSNLTYQQSNYERQNKLFETGAISKAEQETALYQYNTARDNVRSVEAQLTSARRNLSFTDIYSPIDGTVLSRSVSEGQTVAASFNTPTLFSIAKDLTQMQVQASVDEADIGNVKKGQRASFTVDAYPDEVFSGTVKEIRLSPSTSANVVTYTTIIDAPNASARLKPGMTASITIYTMESDTALLVPVSAFNFHPDALLSEKYRIVGVRGPVDTTVQNAVVWVKKDSSLVQTPVAAGMSDETKRLVLSGLSAGDEVVTGYEQAAGTKKETASPSSSPFMPKPPSGSRQRNSGPPPQ